MRGEIRMTLSCPPHPAPSPARWGERVFFWVPLALLFCVFPAHADDSYLQKLIQSAHQKKLSSNPYWHRLLHYGRNLFGAYQSEIDDPSFFASPRGRRDPQAELDATLAAIFTSSPAVSGRGSMDSLPEAAGNDEGSQPAPCRYPARYAWLKEQLAIDPAELPAVPCLRYEKWKSQMNPQAVAVVFASSYMNNPSSMYGHTFLLLKKGGPAGSSELLDYAVNFAADLEHDNGFLYAMKGLLGGYHGRFSTFPYYMKVQEYSNLESRDLWEYDLNLSSASIERLVEHLWELGNVRLRYFFLNKNCSYYLMPLLEVVEPGRDFKREFVFKAIPIDTVRTVLRPPGLLGKVSRRPSHSSKLLAERTRLSVPEIRVAEQLAAIPSSAGVTAIEALTPERQALVLDAAYDLFRQRVGFVREQPPAVQEQEHQLLSLRNQVDLQKEPLPPWRGKVQDGGENLVRPDFGHPTGRVGLSYGFSNRSHFEELSLRSAVHDQEDPPEGYLPGSKLEMFHAKFRYDNDRQTFYVQQLTLIDLMSITPCDLWIHPPSRKVNSGVAVANDLNRDPENSLYYGLNLGSGYAFSLTGAPHPLPSPSRGEGREGVDSVLVYAMGEMELEFGHAYSHFVRFGGGPSAGVLINPVKVWRARLAASYFPYAVGGTPSTTRLGFYQSFSLTKSLELRAKLERQNVYKEVLFTLAWFM